MALGIVVGADMYLFLEPLAEDAVVTLRRATPVTDIGALPDSSIKDGTGER